MHHHHWDMAFARSGVAVHTLGLRNDYPTFIYKDSEECNTGLNPGLALATLGLLLGATFFIITRITNPGMVRRRRGSTSVMQIEEDHIHFLSAFLIQG